MVIEFRLYKKFDMDLIALYNMHYPVASMMRDAVIAYANGRPLHYWVDEPTFFDANDCDAVHSRFNIPDSDTITCYMLSHIKFRCKNAFVKTVLRNALIQQNLTCFFTDNALNQTHLLTSSRRMIKTLMWKSLMMQPSSTYMMVTKVMIIKMQAVLNLLEI